MLEKSRFGAVVIGFALTASIQGCGGGEIEKPVGPVACDVPKIFQASCAGRICHGADDPESLDLVSTGLEDRLFRVPGSADCQQRILVEPGDPDASLLYQKLVMDDPPCGKHMPQGGKDLTSDELECVRKFILEAQGGPSCETCGSLLCVDLASDEKHCGTCGTACGTGKQCAEGVCINPCTASETLCGSACTDVRSDDANCGSCAHRCGPGSTCQDGACVCDPGASARFAADVQPILASSCGGDDCHSSANDVTSLSLAKADAYEQLVGKPADGEGCDILRVAPGDPDKSFLVDKLMGGDLCYGKPMPRFPGRLPDAAIEKFVGWICAGAPND